MLRVEVSVAESQLDVFEEIAKQIGKATKQQAIYVVINYTAQTKILPIDDETGNDLLLGGRGGN
jgi:hypothetical protein